jgi:release factor glutamine methyltransferase
MTVRDFINMNLPALTGLYEKQEATIILESLLCDTLDLPFRISPIDSEKKIQVSDLQKLDSHMQSLLDGIPIQYVTGIAYFMDIKLNVNKDVLIPRPETEEMVELVMKNFSEKNNISVLDIGCGSGCIAIQLARSIPGCEVTALDKSDKAVALTQLNAEQNSVMVKTVICDVLTDAEKINGEFDLIVSNPPYIHPSESVEVDEQVLKFEPHLALFTPEDDVLIFYRKILLLAGKNLRKGGAIYFEVNPSHVEKLSLLVESKGWEVKQHVDISGKTRIFEIGKIS